MHFNKWNKKTNWVCYIFKLLGFGIDLSNVIKDLFQFNEN